MTFSEAHAEIFSILEEAEVRPDFLLSLSVWKYKGRPNRVKFLFFPCADNVQLLMGKINTESPSLSALVAIIRGKLLPSSSSLEDIDVHNLTEAM